MSNRQTIIYQLHMYIFFVIFLNIEKFAYVYCFINTYVSNKYFILFHIIFCVSAKCPYHTFGVISTTPPPCSGVVPAGITPPPHHGARVCTTPSPRSTMSGTTPVPLLCGAIACATPAWTENVMTTDAGREVLWGTEIRSPRV